MTDADFLLSVLEDNQPHSQSELLARSFNERGCGLTVHSRIADLRRKGHVIVCERVEGKTRGQAWRYQLLGSLSEGDEGATDGGGSRPAGPGLSPSLSEQQEELFTFPRSPEWA